MSLASQSRLSSGTLPGSSTLPATGTFITRSAHEKPEGKRDLADTISSSPSSPPMGLMSTTTKSPSFQSSSPSPAREHRGNNQDNRGENHKENRAYPDDRSNDSSHDPSEDKSRDQSRDQTNDQTNDHSDDRPNDRQNDHHSNPQNNTQNTNQRDHCEDREDRNNIKVEQDHTGDFPSDGEQSNTSRCSQDSQASQNSSFLSIQGRDVKDAPRKRRRTTPNELHILEAEFARNNRPGKMDRERIAKLTSMDEKAVQVWFQNKRQSHRRQHNLVTPAAVRTQSMPLFRDENNYMPNPMAPFQFGSANTANNAFQAMLQANAQKFMSNQVLFDESSQPKSAKSLKLSMSADGKAELIERSPLKQLSTNQDTSNPTAFPGYNAFPQPALAASRYASMPTYQPQITGVEQECASSLLVLKFGKWR